MHAPPCIAPCKAIRSPCCCLVRSQSPKDKSRTENAKRWKWAMPQEETIVFQLPQFSGAFAVSLLEGTGFMWNPMT